MKCLLYKVFTTKDYMVRVMMQENEWKEWEVESKVMHDIYYRAKDFDDEV